MKYFKLYQGDTGMNVTRNVDILKSYLEHQGKFDVSIIKLLEKEFNHLVLEMNRLYGMIEELTYRIGELNERLIRVDHKTTPLEEVK